MKSYKEIIRKLSERMQGPVLFDEPMSRHTSFRIGGPADLMLSPAGPEDLKLFLKSAVGRLPYIVIGNGTNLLVADRGIRGAVVWISRGFRQMERHGVRITAGAGLNLPGLVDKCRALGLSGLEWAVGIPGSVGGALVMNAGAYGGQMSDLVERVFGMLPSGRELELKPADIKFAYRQAKYPQGFVITGCRLRLAEGRPASIRRLMEKWLSLRRRNQPLSLPSAGCIFKNPKGDSARRLIGVAGMRGARVGGAQVSRKHANFIVNYGGAKADDVRRLMERVQSAVERDCGVGLEPEVKMIGEW